MREGNISNIYKGMTKRKCNIYDINKNEKLVEYIGPDGTENWKVIRKIDENERECWERDPTSYTFKRSSTSGLTREQYYRALDLLRGSGKFKLLSEGELNEEDWR